MKPVPNWLVAMAEAAGKTAFTDEFYPHEEGMGFVQLDGAINREVDLAYRYEGNIVVVLKCSFLGKTGDRKVIGNFVAGLESSINAIAWLLL